MALSDSELIIDSCFGINVKKTFPFINYNAIRELMFIC